MKDRLLTIFVLTVSLALMLSALGTLAQGPEPGGMGNPMAAQQQTQNVELVGQIGGATNTVAVQGNYAYIVGVGPRLVILNISDPAHPTVVGQTDILHGTVQGVAVVGNYAYITEGGGSCKSSGGGLRIINIANPATPFEVGFYDTWGAAHSVAVAGNYAYVGADDRDGGSLYIINVSNPAVPTQAGFYDTPGGAFYVALAGDYAYVADAQGGLLILRYTGGDGVDLSVESITPIQVLEGQPLVKDKPTAIRVVVSKAGNEAVDDVSVRLIYNSQDFTTFYVTDPTNIDASYSLVNDNSSYPLSFATSEVTKTICFFGDGLMPAQAGQYVVTATVDYLDNIAESDETNNSTSATANVYATSWPLEKAGLFSSGSTSST